MRSAIYFPEITISHPHTMRSALLMWDEVKVIVPSSNYKVSYDKKGLAQAWEIIGSTMHPDVEQQNVAHDKIMQLIAEGLDPKLCFREADARHKDYEMYPEKLLHKTWNELERHRIVGRALTNADYPMHEAAGFAIMAKLADACAGDVFARWTDRFLAFGLAADRLEDTSTAKDVLIPITLSLVDTATIPLENLVAFRKREKKERGGSDYTKMRHKYADTIMDQVKRLSSVKSKNQINELARQFEDEMRLDLKELEDALRLNKGDLVLAPAIISTLATIGTWIATGDPMKAALAAAVATGASAEAVKRMADLFRANRTFSANQRKLMAGHPMAYMYALRRDQQSGR